MWNNSKKNWSPPSGIWAVETEPSEVKWEDSFSLVSWKYTVFLDIQQSLYSVHIVFVVISLLPSGGNWSWGVSLPFFFCFDLCDKKEGKTVIWEVFFWRKAITHTSGLLWYCLEGGNKGAWSEVLFVLLFPLASPTTRRLNPCHLNWPLDCSYAADAMGVQQLHY